MNKRTVYEIGAVIATALFHPAFVDILHQRALFIALSLGGWTCYLGLRVRREPDVLPRLGLRRAGLAPAFVATSLFGMAALASMVLLARHRHGLVFYWRMLPLLALYPIWGTVQQLLVQGIFVRPIAAMAAGVWPKLAVTALAALFFGMAHLPDVRLAAATCVLGAASTLIYLRWRNLWPLGIYHGWLGVFFYYWVLGRDPWGELFHTSAFG